MNESDDYKRGWYDGYQAAQRQTPIIPHPYNPTTKAINRCPVCQKEWGDGAWGYVCYISGCPTRITAQQGATS
jgi:hypothetical protein